MPISAPGSRPAGFRPQGFTLIELLVVVALVAIATATVSLAMRDPQAAQLEREAERLAALFEAARAESRAAGLTVIWAPTRTAEEQANGDQFRFLGLPAAISLPRRWLGEPVAVDIATTPPVVRLGPEPLIGAQRVQLRLGEQRISLVTDGLSPFTVAP